MRIMRTMLRGGAILAVVATAVAVQGCGDLPGGMARQQAMVPPSAGSGGVYSNATWDRDRDAMMTSESGGAGN